MDHRPGRSLMERGLGLLCAVAMAVGVAFGNAAAPDVSASEQAFTSSLEEHTQTDEYIQTGEHTQTDGSYSEASELFTDEIASSDSQETEDSFSDMPPEEEYEEGGMDGGEASADTEKTPSEEEPPSEAEPETDTREMIVITADEANLRAQPSVEAEIIDVVHSGTKLELLGTVEAEETTWYQVNYCGESSSAPETETIQPPAGSGTQEEETGSVDEAEQPEEIVSADETEQSAGTVSADETEQSKEKVSGEETERSEKMESEEKAEQPKGTVSADEIEQPEETGFADEADQPEEIVPADDAEQPGEPASADEEEVTDGTASSDEVLTETPGEETEGNVSDAAENVVPGVEAYVRSDLAEVVSGQEEETWRMTYENDEVLIHVTEVAEGAIPGNAALRVVPLKESDESTAPQYAKVKEKLLEKAEKEGYGIAGFLAYDITFVDENREKLEPNGEVKVSMEYKQPVIPPEAAEAVAGSAGTVQATVMHLEEDASGNVQAVVDLAENNQLTALDMTEAQEIQKAEFVTESFSVFTVTYAVYDQKDPLGLDGNSYVVAKENGAASAVIMQEAEITSTRDGTIRVAELREMSADKQTIYLNGDETATAWTFQWIEGNQYYMKWNDSYLNIQGNGHITLSQEPVVVQVEKRGDGTYRFTNSLDGDQKKAINLFGGAYEKRGFGGWKDDENDTNENLILIPEIVKVPNSYLIVFNRNNAVGGEIESAELNVAASDVDFTFPQPDDRCTVDGKVFVGWSLRADTQEKQVYEKPRAAIYDPGTAYSLEELVRSDFWYSYIDGDKFKITFYAAYGETNAEADYFIRLDGNIPYEPQQHPTANYTDGIRTKAGALQVQRFRFLAEGVDEYLGAQPTLKELRDDINKKKDALGFSVSVGESTTEQGEKERYLQVFEVTDLENEFVIANNIAVGDRVYVRWYVIKHEEDSWHVDGVLLLRKFVNLYYDGNAPAGQVSNVPMGSQFPHGALVDTVGKDGGNAGENKIPVRIGYHFFGWNTEKDGSGTWYNDGDQFTIYEDTELYAQWGRGTNKLTVKKTDPDGTTVLAGATFDLERRKETENGDGTVTYGDWEIVSSDCVTNNDGVFSFSHMENHTVYRLTEIYAPHGYETRNSFCFAVKVSEDQENLLAFYITDDEGNPLSGTAKPDWVQAEYSPVGQFLRLELRIQDEQIRRDVTFKKVREDGRTPLSGAEFKLYRKDARSGHYVEYTEGTWTSDTDGVIALKEKLPRGEYKLEEVKAPEGYRKAVIEFQFGDYSESDHGFKILSGGDSFVKCDVSHSGDDNMATTTYSYTVTVKDERIDPVKWQIVKKSADTGMRLEGAEFTLTSKTDTTVVYHGISDKDGVVKWQDCAAIPEGTYTLEEIKAPDGYRKSGVTWTVAIADGYAPVIKRDTDNTVVDPDVQGSYTYTFMNHILYELPSTGGKGTHQYLIGGGLLMMAAVLATILKGLLTEKNCR